MPPTNHLANGGSDQSSTCPRARTSAGPRPARPRSPRVRLGLLVDRRVRDERLLPERVRGREGLLFEQLAQFLVERRAVRHVCPLLCGSPLAELSWPGRAPSRRRARSRSGRTARGTCAPSPRSVESIVPSKQPRKPSGIEMMPGLASVERQRRARVGVRARPHLRRQMISTIAETTPSSTPVTAPGGVEPPPGEREQQRREVGARRDGEREADHERDVQALAADDGDRRSRSRRSTPPRSWRPRPPPSRSPGPCGRCSTRCRAPPRPRPRARGPRRPRGSSRTRRRR